MEQGYTHNSSKVRWLTLLSWTLGFALLFANVLLVVQNRRLKRELAKEPPAYRPALGSIVLSIEGVSPDGRKVRVEWGDESRDTFLFVFSPHCAVCKLTMPAWRDLAASADTRLHRMVYINTGKTLSNDYLKDMQLPNDAVVISELDPESIVSINIHMTPEVIRIDRNG